MVVVVLGRRPGRRRRRLADLDGGQGDDSSERERAGEGQFWQAGGKVLGPIAEVVPGGDGGDVVVEVAGYRGVGESPAGIRRRWKDVLCVCWLRMDWEGRRRTAVTIAACFGAALADGERFITWEQKCEMTISRQLKENYNNKRSQTFDLADTAGVAATLISILRLTMTSDYRTMLLG